MRWLSIARPPAGRENPRKRRKKARLRPRPARRKVAPSMRRRAAGKRMCKSAGTTLAGTADDARHRRGPRDAGCAELPHAAARRPAHGRRSTASCTALFLARSEAIKRAQIVSMCRSSDGSSCELDAADWSVGWIVFVNSDRDDPPERDAREERDRALRRLAGRLDHLEPPRVLVPAGRRRASSTARSCSATCAAPRTHGPSSSVTRVVRASHSAMPSGKPLRCPSG